jgi:hypothetical protein
MLAIAAVLTSDCTAVVDGGSSGGDEGVEGEETEATKPLGIFFPEKETERSLNEETSWIKGGGPWALNQVRKLSSGQTTALKVGNLKKGSRPGNLV